MTSTEGRNECYKKQSYLSWKDYFMSVAFLSAKRSKDPCSQVGACLVNEDNRIVGVGYNGFPRGCSDDEFPWTKDEGNTLNSKYLYVCHAEMNAILNRNSYNLKECTLYVALFPCNECAKLIIQSGIKTIFYAFCKNADDVRIIASKRMFDAANVKYSEYIPSAEKIVIDFTAINLDQVDQLPPSPQRKDESEKHSLCQSPLLNRNDLSLCDKFQSDLKLSDISEKRQSFLSWDDYFMGMAFLASMRSKDPHTQVGACIVNEDKIIVGIGYNGFPQGCSDDEFPWTKNQPDMLQSKFLYVCHAEVNAILNRNSENLKNCTIYVALFPCNECAKIIIQAGIKKILFLSDKKAHKIGTIASKKMLDAANVEYRQYVPNNLLMEIDFQQNGN
ncbi:deoxycytidylate deaminase [Leptopilina heterotoma]|uniref:deoxycytidylate deaminase n=1 Tax=Leptopilina heterotoma TaxID=63436 RepID=UPI001CA89032|nr:deoxycytidylate deaminase [Leptopilina heterotoma]